MTYEEACKAMDDGHRVTHEILNGNWLFKGMQPPGCWDQRNASSPWIWINGPGGPPMPWRTNSDVTGLRGWEIVN